MSDGDQHEDDRLREDPDSDTWTNWQGAVLLKDEIRRYCAQDPPLIDPFEDNDEMLKPASYHLRLGDKCRVDGDDIDLSADDPVLRIPPHGIAIVRTHERLNIPGFLIARWNLKVKMVYTGLVWVGSLQVDPGYYGHLICPMYNLSSREQVLHYKDPLFTIDFVKTTRFDANKGCQLWGAKPRRSTTSIGALDTMRLQSAPAASFALQDNKLASMMEQLASMMEQLKEAREKADRFHAITLTVIGLIIAALSFMGATRFAALDTSDPNVWQTASWGVMLFAIVTMTAVIACFGIDTIRGGKADLGNVFRTSTIFWLLMLTVLTALAANKIW